MEEKKLVKPFTVSINRGDTSGEKAQESEQTMPMDTLAIVRAEEEKRKNQNEHVKLERPFTTKDTPEEKMYLILMQYSADNSSAEYERDWAFFRGTTQDLYDHLKTLISDPDIEFDVMKSRLLVNGEKSRLTNNVSVYAFMLGCQEKNKITEETPFDISEYYYELSDDEEAEFHGEERTK